MSRDTVASSFKALIRTICDLAESQRLTNVPTSEYSFSYLKNVTPNRAEEVTETTSFHSVEALVALLFPQRERSPVEAVSSACVSYELSLGQGPLVGSSVYRLLNDYFDSETKGNIREDSEAVDRVLTRYFEAIETTPVDILTTLLWRGVSASAPFDLATNIHFRPVEASDYHRFGRFGPSHLVQSPPLLQATDWIAEIRTKQNFRPLNGPTELQEQVTSAVTLATKGRAQIYLLGVRCESVYLDSGFLWNPVPTHTARSGQQITLTQESIQAAQRVFYRLAATINTKRYLTVPLRRLKLSAHRTTAEDELVDLVIGLESLLAPDTPNLEVTFRFRLRGAALLPQDAFGNASQRLHLMSNLYAARSKAVHGGTVSGIESLCDTAAQALKAIISHFLFHDDLAAHAKNIIRMVDEAMVEALA